MCIRDSTLALGIATTLLLPNFWQQALINSKGSVSTTGITKRDEKIQSLITEGPEQNYQISDLGLELNYPSYTRLPSKVIKPSDGSVKSLPGTEVTIEGKTNEGFHEATLVVNIKDSILMESKDPLSLKGAFMVRERGFYQFRLKDQSGTQVLLPQKYPIELEQDQTPRVVLLPANPKPVYYDSDKIQIFYEGSDDFGIQNIDLVAQIDDNSIRKKINNFKENEKETQGRFTWNLALESLEPGQEVQYYLEIKDNDNISGPNKGQSEMIRFTIFDSREALENLVQLQDELTEKMIALLATGLVEDNILKTTTKDILYGKKLLASNADALIEIIEVERDGVCQRIGDLAEGTHQRLLEVGTAILLHRFFGDEHRE